MAFGFGFGGYSPRTGDMRMDLSRLPAQAQPHFPAQGFGQGQPQGQMPVPPGGQPQMPTGAQGLALGRLGLAPGQVKPVGESARMYAPGYEHRGGPAPVGQDAAANAGAAQNMPGQRPGGFSGGGQQFNPFGPQAGSSGLWQGFPDEATRQRILEGLMARRAAGLPPLSFYDLIAPVLGLNTPQGG